MYKRLSNFLDINNLIYSLRFGFQPKYSTINALINLTESIRQTLDRGSFGFFIFADLQKAFYMVDHKNLLHKLEYYRIWGICNDWFKSYLLDHKQFVSINEYNSDMKHFNNWLSANKISLNVEKTELVISKISKETTSGWNKN